jgi:hypothetical protein
MNIKENLLTQAILPLYIFNRPFSFLDIGCSNPAESCCYELTQIGCKGHFVDINHFDGWDGLNFHQIDATKTNWDFVETAEFVQIDVEGLGKRLEVLTTIPLERLDTKIISIEHDGYRNKHKMEDYESAERNPQREYLKSKGYKILYKDVSNKNGEAYEDWWIRNDLWEQNKSLYCENEKDLEIQTNLNNIWQENTYQH